MLQFFCEDLEVLDPAVASLIKYEGERQQRKLILIPSESQAPEAVREALGSVFQNIYAEGYPDARMHGLDEAGILDYETSSPATGGIADQRYYKGVEYVERGRGAGAPARRRSVCRERRPRRRDLGERAAALRLARQQRRLRSAGARWAAPSWAWTCSTAAT